MLDIIEDPLETNSLLNKLRREEIKFIHLRAETICIKDFSYSFNILGKKIGPFKIGHTYKLENYIARPFVENGILAYTDEYHIDEKVIQQINFSESTSKQMNKIKDGIYIQAREELKIARKLHEHNKMTYRQMTQLFSDVNDLIAVRLAKITRLTKSANNNLEAKKYLNTEEQLLFEKLAEHIKEWKEYLSKI